MLATLKHPRKAFLGAGAALVGGCFISAAVGGTTIDFNGLSGSDGSPFTSYAESGFTVARLSGSWLVGKNYGNPPPYILFRNPPTTTASVAVTGAGAPFSFRSIDLYSSTTPIPFTFTGLLNGNTVFTVSGTVPNTFGNFATVSNPHETDRIDTLQVTLSNPSNPNVPNPVGLDNIVVVAPGSTVPEPEGRRQRRAMASPPRSAPSADAVKSSFKTAMRRRLPAMKGSCLCGAIQYEVLGLGNYFGFDHCSRCRKATGSAFAAEVICNAAEFRWVSGSSLVKTYEAPVRRTPPGYRRAFCTTCGGPVPIVDDHDVNVPAGTLDDDPGLRPSAHIFVDFKAPWFEITDSLLQFGTKPTSG